MVKAPRTPKVSAFHGVSLVGLLQTPASISSINSDSSRSSGRNDSSSSKRSSSSSPSKYDLELSAHKRRDLGKFTTESVSKYGRVRKLALGSYEGTHDGGQPKEKKCERTGHYYTGEAAKKATKRTGKYRVM